jgi:hypothetical protein
MPSANTASSTDRADSAEKPERRTTYCPKCRTRYAYDASECVTCGVPLTAEQPPDESIFRPKIDLPFLLFAAVFLGTYARLPGEAQSFGLIALIVGAATIVTFRVISRAEWLGRR